MSRSPYAAPNSPIASSKRARTHTGSELRSPSSGVGSRERNMTGATSPGALKLDVPSSSFSRGTVPGSSKVIFSPAGARGGASTPRSEAVALAAARAERERAAAAAAEEEDVEEFDPYVFIKGLPDHRSVAVRGKICLPPKPKHMKDLVTLTLDLDETLVHCSIEPIPNPDIIFPVSFQGTNYEVYVRKRPHLDHFLQKVSKLFEVVVFTASQKVYADKLLDLIDPQKSLIRNRLFREACLCVQGNFVKDLSVLDRDLKKTVLVDNSPHAYAYNVNNGIPIISWFDDENDTELLKLLDFLERLREPRCDDVRSVVRDQFKTFRLVEDAGRVPYRGQVPPLV
jgi:CTD small phosphatase-like protein 2